MLVEGCPRLNWGKVRLRTGALHQQEGWWMLAPRFHFVGEGKVVFELIHQLQRVAGDRPQVTRKDVIES